MKAVINAVGVMALCAALSASLFAQWPTYPTYPVPKTPSGEPNLSAPAPRPPTASRIFPESGGALRPAAGRTTSAVERRAAPRHVSGHRFDIQGRLAADAVRGRAVEEADGPQQQRQSRGPLSADGHHAVSHARGAPEVRPDPGLIVILYEASSGIRQIFTDGRPLPNNDPQPWFYGYSTGKWDGDTLVVETSNLRDDGWLDIIGTPLTDAAKLTERFRRVSYGRMEIDITVDDPKAYTKPWTVRHVQEIMPDGELIEFICEENQRFPPQ